jgi:tetratricopeptide (TPR) repeat protein
VDATPIDELLQLCQDLLAAHPATRLVFTSREALPAPFNHAQRSLRLGTLDRTDALELVSQVMAQEGLSPHPNDAGQTPQEIIDLVEAVNCHPRALVLLAREVSRQGVKATTANWQHLMAELHKRHPNDRENSLYASVELSLRRLSPKMREQTKALAVFHGGTSLIVLMDVLEIDAETVAKLAKVLVNVGLAELTEHFYLCLDPALPSYLLGEIDTAEQEQLRLRWAEGMKKLIGYLCVQRTQEATVATQLTLREMSNLLTLLQWLQVHATPEDVANIAGQVEELLAHLGRPQALAQVANVREQAARALSEWGQARFEAERRSIERLLDQGNLRAAQSATQQLLRHSLHAGDASYPGAAFDIASAYFMFGRVLKLSGCADAALAPLAEAQRRFQTLAEGNISAARLASLTITERGDCLADLGRLEEAEVAYTDSIRRAEKLDDKRQVAVAKAQLGTVRMLQRRYAEALKIYIQARALFESLGEPGSVAVAWHKIGMVHRKAKQFEEAEHAYRQALSIWVQYNHLASEADSLSELGNLYNDMNRGEEAVAFFRQAANIYVSLQDLNHEGITRNDLAHALLKLQRYNDARVELQRTIECRKPFGHAAQPWKTWDNLHTLELAVGDFQAAAQARQQAIESYLAYRQDGGGSHEQSAQRCSLVEQAIQQGKTAELEQILAQVVNTDIPLQRKVLLARLRTILKGDRNLSLASDPELDYTDAAELQLLLERLNTG